MRGTRWRWLVNSSLRPGHFSSSYPISSGLRVAQQPARAVDLHRKSPPVDLLHPLVARSLNYAPSRRGLAGQLSILSSELSSLQIESNARLNEPGRWGDAAAANPANDIVSFLQNVLDLIRRIKDSKRV